MRGSVMPPRAAWRVVACLALAALAPRPAAAHDAPYSFIDLRVGPRGIEGRVMAHVVDLAHDAGLADPAALLDANVARAHTTALHAVLERRLQLVADGARVRPRWTSRSALPDRKLLVFEFVSPGAAHALALQGPLFPYDPLHETFVNVYAGGALRVQDLLDHRHTRIAWSDGTPRPGAAAVARRFVLQGVRHIFIGPDHILFVVGLLLLGGGLARLLKIVSAFTLAHSITLALAALQLVHPSPRVIEPAIALSIVCVGIENLLAAGRPRDVRALLAFAFGFVHGFGFAGVLQEFGLPRGSLGIALASFNVGVEIGQACIVLAVLPIVALARRAGPEAARRLVWAGSGVVIAAGAFWFVQRVWFPA